MNTSADSEERHGTVLVTGATGFIGRALVQRLLGTGRHVIAWVRDPARARSQLGPDVTLCPIEEGDAGLVEALGRADGVVHLAGESLMAKRWSAAQRRALRDSRVGVTERLVAAMARATPAPRVLVAGSAVGFYGDRDDELLTEDSPAGSGYLARLCEDWEAAAAQARGAGVRVVHLRTGLVVGHGGGVLGATLPIFRLGLGGPLGHGRQYMPWIALDDHVEIVLRCLEDSSLDGALNATAPEPVTSRQYAQALGAALGRPAFMPAPSFALHLVLGARAEALLTGQRAIPAHLLGAGFSFRHRTLGSALSAVVADEREVDIARLPAGHDGPADATYLLRARTALSVSPEEAFAFFGQAENLGLITPAFMGFEIIQRPEGPIGVGSEIAYRIKLGPTTMRWKTLVPHWDPPRRFVDDQTRGPYRRWWHEHRIEPAAHGSTMIDEVYYAPPLGLLGRLAHFFVIERTLRAIFAFRSACIRRLFGGRAPRPQLGAAPPVEATKALDQSEIGNPRR